MRAHDAEHEYVQMPCGVMDQLISSCGQYGKISLIDCISHDIQHFDICPDADPSSPIREWPVTILKLFVHVEHKSSDSFHYITSYYIIFNTKKINITVDQKSFVFIYHFF